MEHPITVFKGRYEGSFAVLTEMNIGGKNVLVSIDINKGAELNVNIITSLYGKDRSRIVRWIEADRLLYADKKKTLDYLIPPAPMAGDPGNFGFSEKPAFLHYPAPIAETLKKPESVTATKIVTNFENPKIGPEYSAPKGEHIRFFRTPQGEVYGFTTGGVIYLDGARMNARAPMHEYTELWSQIVAAENPAWWRRAKELMATDEGRLGAIWHEVNDAPNYKDLGEDLRASETLSRATAELFEREWLKDYRQTLRRVPRNRRAPVFRTIRVVQTARTKGAVRVTIPASSPYHCSAVERTMARVAHPIAPRTEGVASARAQSTPL